MVEAFNRLGKKKTYLDHVGDDIEILRMLLIGRCGSRKNKPEFFGVSPPNNEFHNRGSTNNVYKINIRIVHSKNTNGKKSQGRKM